VRKIVAVAERKRVADEQLAAARRRAQGSAASPLC
jgi:hypothetical protein